MLAFTEWGNSRQPGRGSPPFHTHGAPAGRRPCPLWPERQQLSRRERSRCAGAGGRACQTLGSPPPPCQQAVQSHQCQSCQLKKKKLSIVDLQCCVNFYGASLVAQRLKRLPGMRETRVRSLGWEDPLEKAVAPHSSILAWRIPWTEEPGRLQFMGSQRVGHN